MSVIRALAFAGTLVTLVARPGFGQYVPLRLDPAPPACQFDTAAVRDTASFTLYVTPPGNAAGGADLRQSYGAFISAVADAFEVPGRVTMATWPGTFYHEPSDQPTGGTDLACEPSGLRRCGGRDDRRVGVRAGARRGLSGEIGGAAGHPLSHRY